MQKGAGQVRRPNPRRIDSSKKPANKPAPAEEYTVYSEVVKIPIIKPTPTTTNGSKNRRKLFPEFGRTSKYSPITSIEEYLESEKMNFENRYNCKIATDRCTPDEFEYIRFLGKGAFGVVNMVRKRDNSIYYARKEMSKHHVVLNSKVGEVKTEKLILQSIRFPFTIHLKYHYQDFGNIYFVLPLMSGGELYGYIKTLGKLNEHLGRFILSQLLLALEYLHYLGLIHRDIKLENMLVDHVGYIKLADFGMCKWIKHGRTYTICGTAEYLAPEVLNHTGYGLAADWWSFGVLAFEICSGRTPFLADEYLQIFYLITHNQYEMPKSFSYPLSNLISHLLEVDLTRRYGNLKDGVDDIKSHDFFKHTHWIELINRKIDSPLLTIMKLPESEFYEPQPQPPVIKDSLKAYNEHFMDF